MCHSLLTIQKCHPCDGQPSQKRTECMFPHYACHNTIVCYIRTQLWALYSLVLEIFGRHQFSYVYSHLDFPSVAEAMRDHVPSL